MSRNITRLTALIVLVLSTFVPASLAAQDASPAATPATGPDVESAVAWLIEQQQEDGSWLGMSGEPDAGTTIDAAISLAAADTAGIDVGEALDNALAWLDADGTAAEYAERGPGSAAKVVLLLVAVGDESLEIGGVTPLEIVLEGHDVETGLYGFGLYDHSYSLMAMAATDSEIPAEAVSVLETMQADNGGFAWDGSTDEDMIDSNTTAMVVQALVAAGEGDSSIVASGLGYLRLTVSDQGAGYSIGAEPDANSTAIVAQAFMATGEDVTHLLTALDQFQNPNGAFFWMHTDVSDNHFTTAQVIPAALGMPMPVVPAAFELEEAA